LAKPSQLGAAGSLMRQSIKVSLAQLSTSVVCPLRIAFFREKLAIVKGEGIIERLDRFFTESLINQILCVFQALLEVDNVDPTIGIDVKHVPFPKPPDVLRVRTSREVGLKDISQLADASPNVRCGTDWVSIRQKGVNELIDREVVTRGSQENLQEILSFAAWPGIVGDLNAGALNSEGAKRVNLQCHGFRFNRHKPDLPEQLTSAGCLE
jgi:hypothetical protein